MSQQHGGGTRNTSSGVTSNTLDKDLDIIIRGDSVASAEKTIELASQFGKSLSEGNLKASQIRNVFGQVRQIEMNGWQGGALLRPLKLLKPKLAYQAARNRPVKPLSELLALAIDKVSEEIHFQRFVEFFEAILAYHKANGGE